MGTSTDLGKIWTEGKCVALIRKFKENPILWDIKNDLFYKQDCKRRIWDDIGKELQITGKDCKHKMGILMSSFRREKAKLINGLKTGIHYKSTWFGFKELSFLFERRSLNGLNMQVDNSESERSNILWQAIKYDASSINSKEPLPDNNEKVTIVVNESEGFIEKIEPLDQQEEFDDDEESHYMTDLLQLTIPEKHSIESRPSMSSVTSSITYEHNFVKSEPFQQPSTKTFTSTNNSDRMKEITTFNNFIQAKMKKYSAKTLSEVQKAICDVIFKADKNYYENNSASDAFVAGSGTRYSLKRKRLDSEQAELEEENENNNDRLKKL